MHTKKRSGGFLLFSGGKEMEHGPERGYFFVLLKMENDDIGISVLSFPKIY